MVDIRLGNNVQNCETYFYLGSSWTPDPSIGHLLYTMRGVGPKIVIDDHGAGTNGDEAEEDYEFLEHLLKR